ncbi:MAG TPA: glycosyltransferase [Terriglobales bacterium]|nr:glycosyltransferase [Terriglobales bacterium]
MKVLRIIARLNVGGPARHVVWLTEGLSKHGYETLLVTGVVPPGEDDMGYLAAEAGISPIVIAEMSRELSPKDLLTTWKVFRLMRRECPDIVHTHTAKAGAVGRAAGLMYRWFTPGANCRFVHTYHGHIFHGYYGPLKTRLFLTIEKLLARLVTDRIVVVSEQQAREINDTFRVGRREQFRVIPLGIELDQFANWRARRQFLRKELGANDAEILVGIVGRLTEIKNHQMFLEVAAKYKTIASDKSRRVRFVIVGDGSLRSDLEKSAKSLGLSDDVVFLGNRNDPEKFYPGLDIVALTSLNEGTPLTLIEAMANTRAVIATAVGGVVDLLGKPAIDQESEVYVICERGISIKSGDSSGFARGLNYLVENAELRDQLGHNGLDFVGRNYAKERLLQDIAALYREFANHAEAAPLAHEPVNSPSVREGS